MKIIILLLTTFAAFGQIARPTFNPFNNGMMMPNQGYYNNNFGFPNNTNHPLNFHRPNNFGIQNTLLRPTTATCPTANPYIYQKVSFK